MPGKHNAGGCMCCDPNVADNCFGCEFAESISISSSAVATGIPSPSCDLPTVDGTYDLSLFVEPPIDADPISGPCTYEFYLHEAICSGTVQYIRLRVGFYEDLGFGRALRAVVLYERNNNTDFNVYRYYKGYSVGDPCPTGTVNIPLTSSTPQSFSSAPTVDFNFP